MRVTLGAFWVFLACCYMLHMYPDLSNGPVRTGVRSSGSVRAGGSEGLTHLWVPARSSQPLYKYKNNMNQRRCLLLWYCSWTNTSNVMFKMLQCNAIPWRVYVLYSDINTCGFHTGASHKLDFSLCCCSPYWFGTLQFREYGARHLDLSTPWGIPALIWSRT